MSRHSSVNPLLGVTFLFDGWRKFVVQTKGTRRVFCHQREASSNFYVDLSLFLYLSFIFSIFSVLGQTI